MKQNKNKLYLLLVITLLAALTIPLFPQEQGYIKSGFDAINSKNYPLAIESYSKSIEKQPSYAPAYYGRGLAYSFLEKFSESNIDLLKATELDRKYHQAYYALGINYSKTAMYDKALAAFTDAISIDGKAAGYYYARANAYLTLKQLDKSLVDYNKAIELDAKLGLAYYGRAIVHKTEGRGDQSLKDFESYLTLNGNGDGLESEVTRLKKEILEEKKK